MRAAPLALAWAAAVGLWGTWSLTSSFSRYLLPHLPVLALVLAIFLEALPARLRPWTRALIFTAALANGIHAALLFRSLGSADVVLGKTPAAEYLKIARPSYHAPSYAAVEFINEKLPGSKVLFLGEGRAFHCRGDCVAPTIYDQHPLQLWLREVKSAAELGARLRAEGFTHLLVNRMELARWQSGPRRSLAPDPRSLKVWQEYLGARGEPIFEHKHPPGRVWPDAWSVVYELRPSKLSRGGAGSRTDTGL